jgi:hypothetical protein
MFLAQQSSRLFNAVVENLEEAYGEIGMYIVFLLIKHKDEIDYNLISKEKEPYLKEIFDNLTMEDVHLKFNFNIASTEVEQTEEAKRQRLLTLSQLYSMYGQQTLQLLQSMLSMAQQLGPQATMPLMQKYQEFGSQFLVGSSKLMKEILGFFDVSYNGLLPYTKDIEMMLEMMKSLKDYNIQMKLGGMLNGNNGEMGANPAGAQVPGGSEGRRNDMENVSETGGSVEGPGPE